MLGSKATGRVCVDINPIRKTLRGCCARAGGKSEADTAVAPSWVMIVRRLMAGLRAYDSRAL
jgi:hypothetical protein